MYLVITNDCLNRLITSQMEANSPSLYQLAMLGSLLVGSLSYLMENFFGEWRSKRHIRSWWVRRIDVWLAVWCLNNKLLRSKERPKVFVKVLLLFAGLAAWSWPEIYRVCSCFDIHKAWTAHSNEDHREENNGTWISDTESTPWCKCHPQAVLKPFTKPLTTSDFAC